MPDAGLLCVTVDNLGKAKDVGTGAATKPDADEPGLKIGLPNALALFDEHDVKATFFVEGWNGLHHPDAIEAMLRGGHEVGLHGWVHEKWATLDGDRQEVLLWDGTAALRRLGASVEGFRAPGGYRGARTTAVLIDLGYRYDSSIDAETEADPVTVRTLADGLVCVPWHWEMNDYWQYYLNPAGPQTPEDVVRSWSRVFERTAEAGGLTTWTLHPFVSFADPHKLAVVRSLLAFARDEIGLELVSAKDVADRFSSRSAASAPAW